MRVDLIDLDDLCEVLQKLIPEHQRMARSVHNLDLRRVDYYLGGAARGLMTGPTAMPFRGRLDLDKL